jgi:acyl carrier protein
MPGKTWTPREIKQTVVAEISTCVAANGLRQVEIAQTSKLQPTLGLSSLDIVQLIESLNEKFNANPFRTEAMTDLQTVGDLCRVYIDAVSSGR